MALFGSTLALAQLGPPTDSARENMRERARVPYRDGLEQMRLEDLEGAGKSFEAAIRIDPMFDMAHYMLGRVHLATRKYTSAVYALSKAREVYISEANREFGNKQEAQRHRRDRLAVIDDRLLELRAIRPQTYPIGEEIRQLEERKRQIEDKGRAQDNNPATLVPAFVSLSLGSAYFRSGKLPEAERAYRDAIAADPKVGEAHNNLAVVYMETGRLDEAERSIKAAEGTGFKVVPALKDEIKKRRGKT